MGGRTAPAKCPICRKKRGRRACSQRNGTLICPLCCAALRTPNDCESCEHFASANAYQKARAQQGAPAASFVVRVDDEVEEAVDRALQLVETRRRAQGESTILRLYKENPDLHCTRFAMGVLKLLDEDLDEAVRYFQLAVQTYPYFPEAHYNLYSCFIRMRRVADALRALREAHSVAHVGSALHVKTGEMVCHFEDDLCRSEGVDMDTFINSLDLFRRALAAMERKDYRAAVPDLKAYIGLRPRKYLAYGNLGICYRKCGMEAEADVMFSKALELNPDYDLSEWNEQSFRAMVDEEMSEVAEEWTEIC